MVLKATPVRPSKTTSARAMGDKGVMSPKPTDISVMKLK